MDISTILENLTPGAMMYYGGYLGIGIGIVLLLICSVAFPIKRKKVLKKLGEE